MSQPLLTAALIVRDEEDNLHECLWSLRGLADELVVVDTGSVDDSVMIAEEYGARVFHSPWSGSFSEPRNLGLEQAHGRWILYIDADERVRPLDPERLVARLKEAPEVGLRIMLAPFVHATPFLEYRMWRNDPRIRFEGVMHERVVDAIHRVAQSDRRPIGDWPELILDHVGYEGEQQAKHRRNLPLLREQLSREPGNIFNWCHLSQVLRALDQPVEAQRALDRAIELERSRAVPTREGSLAWGELVQLRHDAGDDVEALLREGRKRWPEQWLLCWIQAHVHLQAGRPRQAEDCFRLLLSVSVSELPAAGVAYDERIFGEFALESLGLALFRQGRYGEAAATWGQAEQRYPNRLAYHVKRVLAESKAG